MQKCFLSASIMGFVLITACWGADSKRAEENTPPVNQTKLAETKTEKDGVLLTVQVYPRNPVRNDMQLDLSIVNKSTTARSFDQCGTALNDGKAFVYGFVHTWHDGNKQTPRIKFFNNTPVRDIPGDRVTIPPGGTLRLKATLQNERFIASKDRRLMLGCIDDGKGYSIGPFEDIKLLVKP